MKILIVSEGKPHELLSNLAEDKKNSEIKCVNPKQALGLYHRWGPEWVIAPAPWLEHWLKNLRDPHTSVPRVQLQSRTHQGIQILPVSEVLYFQAEDKYINAISLHDSLLLEETLNHLEEEFASQFIRVHRKTLVNRQAFRKLIKSENGQYFIELKGLVKKFPVSRRQLSKVRKWLKSLEDNNIEVNE